MAPKTRASSSKTSLPASTFKPSASPRIQASNHAIPGVDPPTRSLRPRKRPPPMIEETRSKRRRGEDLHPRSRRTRVGARALGKLVKMRDGADAVRRIVTETEEAMTRATTSVKDMLKDIMSEVRRAETPANGIHGNDVAQSKPSHTGKHTSQGEDANVEQAPDVKAMIVALGRRSSDGGKPSKRFSSEDLRSLFDAVVDALPEGNASCCTCRPTAKQQMWIDQTEFVRPRPRIGVDAHGVRYQDWSPCPMGLKRPEPCVRRERVLRIMLHMDGQGSARYQGITRPERLCPRQPRVSTTQFRLQFQHIPHGVLDELECWHLDRGRCGNCIVRALRTFPPWIIGSDAAESFEDGNPVFQNYTWGELAEWDESEKRWQHLVLDHYRWIPVEDLVERPSDNEADPKIVNGSEQQRIPSQSYITCDD